jgi:hypothetical protein
MVDIGCAFQDTKALREMIEKPRISLSTMEFLIFVGTNTDSPKTPVFGCSYMPFMAYIRGNAFNQTFTYEKDPALPARWGNLVIV